MEGKSMNTPHQRKLLTGLLAVGVPLLAAAWAQQQEPTTDLGQFDKKSAAKAFKKPYSPCAGRTYPTRPLFGDTHFHTVYSFDAGAFWLPARPEGRLPIRQA
jgi:hypothetical protein